MTLRDLADWVIYTGAVVGALSALGVAAGWIARRWRRWLREEIRTLRAPIETTRRNSEQLTSNGGTSVSDQVRDTHRAVMDLTVRFDRHLEHHAGMTAVRQEFRIDPPIDP